MTLTNEIQEEAVHYPYSVVVRFRGEGKPYSFGAMDSNYLKDDWVVVETQQGMEMGQVQADCLDVDKYGLHVPTKPVIRKATEFDHRAFEENLEMEKDAFSICNKEIENPHICPHLLCRQAVRKDGIRHCQYARPSDSDSNHGEIHSGDIFEPIEGKQSQTAQSQANGMGQFPAYPFGYRDKEQGKQHGHEIIDAEQFAHLISCQRIFLRRWIRGTIQMFRYCRRGINPHGKESEPGEELAKPKLQHDFRHTDNVLQYFQQAIARSVLFFSGMVRCIEFSHFCRRILFRFYNGP